jgi:hypothetical protein
MHIVHQKHPVIQAQMKLDVASRPKSPATSPDKSFISNGGGAGGERPTSPSSPIIDLTPHLSNLPVRGVPAPAAAVVTQAKAAAAVVKSGVGMVQMVSSLDDDLDGGGGGGSGGRGSAGVVPVKHHPLESHSKSSSVASLQGSLNHHQQHEQNEHGVNLHHTQHGSTIHHHQHSPPAPLKRKVLKKSKLSTAHKQPSAAKKMSTTGPASLLPGVNCPCDADHAKMTTIFDGVVAKASVPYVWQLLYTFSSSSSSSSTTTTTTTTTTTQPSHFFRHFLNVKRKCTDFKCSHWVPESVNLPIDFQEPPPNSNNHTEQNEEEPSSSSSSSHPKLGPGHHRRFQYIMPLNNPMGPKQTRCQVHETILHHKVSDGYVCFKGTSVSPDVPSGGTFVAHLRTCWMRVADGKGVRLRVSCDVEFNKTPWLLQREYYYELLLFLLLL